MTQRYKPLRFTFVLDDGRKAKCWRAQHQDYNDARISAGIVKNLPPETCYLMFERPHEEPYIYFMRTDEALAAAWVLTGALWSLSMQELDDGK